MAYDCKDFRNFVDVKILVVLYPIGTILNILTAIAFICSFDLKSRNLFKYLLVQTICNGLYMLNDFIIVLYEDCLGCILLETYSSCEYGFTFIQYCGIAASMLSMFCEIAANFDRYRAITFKFEIFDKIPFSFKITAMISVCVCYYSYWFFAFGCELINLEQLNVTSNATEYYPFYNSFGKSSSFFYFQIISRCTRDFICNLILCVLNVMTLTFLRKQLQLKKDSTPSSSQANSDVSRAEKIQSKLNHMVLVCSLITFIGHMPKFIYLFVPNQCFIAIANLLIFVSYSFNFFVYFIYLEQFRLFFKKALFKAIQIGTLNYVRPVIEEIELSRTDEMM